MPDNGRGRFRSRPYFLMLAAIGAVVCGLSPALSADKTPLALAVLDFEAVNTSSSMAAVATDFVRMEFVNGGQYRIVDKGSMEKILTEQAFQQTGCTSQECAVKMGKILNARYMVVGSYRQVESTNYMTAKFIEVETGQIVHLGNVDNFDAKNLRQACKSLYRQLIGEESSGDVGTARPRDSGPRSLVGGRVGIGLNSPGAGIRYMVSNRFCVEARGQYMPEAIAAGPRLVYYLKAATGLYPYIGVEGDYITWKLDEGKGTGYGGCGFLGVELFIMNRVSFQADFGPAYVTLKEKPYDLSVSGIEYAVNFGLTYYIGK